MAADLRATRALDLSGRHLVLGITGGIAAYKAAELSRRLQDHGATVQVVMTEAATRFITPVTLQALTGRPVFTDQWDPRPANNMAHIDLSREADAIVVAPASTDFIAKLAHGLCDDLLSTLCIARDTPLFVVPAMNRQMWTHPATQRNVARIVADGIVVLGPSSGEQACGETGDGRMVEPNEIVADLVASFQPQRLVGRRFVVTAGPTREAIDPVRAITNHSSGRMGYAIAQAAREAGADVTLISGPTSLPTPRGVARVDVETARQVLDATMISIPGADCFVAVAAVADWRVADVPAHKLKKQDGRTGPDLTWIENPDILAAVAAQADAPYCVGFAAETDDLDANAEAKRVKKHVAMIVGNRAVEAFGRDDNAVTLYEAGGRTVLPRAAKLVLARQIVAVIASRLPARKNP